jgi:hypothetical protein
MTLYWQLPVLAHAVSAVASGMVVGSGDASLPSGVESFVFVVDHDAVSEFDDPRTPCQRHTSVSLSTMPSPQRFTQLHQRRVLVATQSMHFEDRISSQRGRPFRYRVRYGPRHMAQGGRWLDLHVVPPLERRECWGECEWELERTSRRAETSSNKSDNTL